MFSLLIKEHILSFNWINRVIYYCSYFCHRIKTTGRGSSVGSVFASNASGLKNDPRVRHILPLKKMFYPLPLIQKKAIDLTNDFALNTGKLHLRGLPRNIVVNLQSALT